MASSGTPQRSSLASSTSATAGSSSPGHSVPPRSSTRYRTASKPPPQFETVEAALIANQGRNGYADTNEIVGVIRSAARTAYGEDSSASELVRFLTQYGAITKSNSRVVVNQERLRRVRTACEQGEDLPMDFVIASNAKGANGGAALERAPLQPKYSAYLTHDERDALEVIDADLSQVFPGEFRIPKHSDPEEYAKSVIGQLFGRNHDVFDRLLKRFIAAGILRKVDHTGPGGTFDAYAFVVPYKEIRIFHIDERFPVSVPGFVMDLIVRVLDTDGFSFFKDESVTTTLRRVMLSRLTNRGAREVEPLVDIFVPLFCGYNQMHPETGWGLALQNFVGGEILLCFPGFGPVQFVKDSVFMGKMMIPAIPAVETKKLEVITPEPIVDATLDIAALDDEALNQRIVDTDALLVNLVTENSRRQAERDEQARLARRAEAQTRLEAARRQAEEARLAAEVARLAAEALEAELAQM